MSAEGARSHRRILPLLLIIIFISHFNRVSMSVAGATELIPHLGISPVRMGLVYSIFLLCYTLAMAPAGWLADRKGPWLLLGLMLAGTGLLQAATGAIGLTVGASLGIWASLLVVRAAMGILTAPLHPSAARTIANWFPPERRSLANGVVVAGAGLGLGSTIYLFGWQIRHFGWPGAFLVSGVATVAVAALWFLLGGDRPGARRAVPRPTTARGQRPTGIRILHSRPVLLLALAYGAQGYFEYIFFYWMQYYFGSVLHLDAARTDLFSTIPLFAFAAGMPVGGWIGDALERRLGVARGRPLVPFAGMLLSAAGLGVGIFVENPLAIVVCFSIALAAIGAVEPLCWTAAIDLGGPLGTTAAGLMNTGGNVGGFLAPIITPWISGIFGWGAGLGLGAVVCLSGAVCWRWIRLPSPDPALPQQPPSSHLSM